jgi:hypothetical protein
MAFPLHAAARNGDVASLMAQIGEGANLEVRDAQVSSVRYVAGAAWAPGMLGTRHSS